MKKLILAAITIVVILSAIYIVKINRIHPVPTPVVVEPIVTPTISLCFYQEFKTSRGLYDSQLLRLNLSGTSVAGEYQNLPAEKDKKVGTFSGTVSAVDKLAMARYADVWWNSMAEGMQVKEQLKITFGEGNAEAGFGEMVDRGDGTYVYKDPAHLTYGKSMTDVACSDLDDRTMVEKYIRANIATLAPSKPVLGGTWYITSVHIDPAKKTGIMAYEDGHIASSATFSYIRTEGNVTLSNIIKK
jgi:hypothetical protein